jgi:hypothetical protein
VAVAEDQVVEEKHLGGLARMQTKIKFSPPRTQLRGVADTPQPCLRGCRPCPIDDDQADTSGNRRQVSAFRLLAGFLQLHLRNRFM